MNLKKISIVVVAAVFAFSGCSGSSVGVDEAEKGFFVAFTTVMMATFSAAFGEAPEGVTLSEDKLTMTLEKFDLSEFEGVGYTDVSGKVVNEDGVMKCDLKMSGGVVKTIKFDISDLNNDHVQMTIEVNGKDVDIDITSEEFDAMEAG